VIQNIGKLSPIVCKSADYEKKDSWCSEGKRFFFDQWHCEEDTGLTVAIRINEKSFKVECLSTNGKKCATGAAAAKACRKANTCEIFRKKVKKIACSQSANTSSNPNWCQRGFAYFTFNNEYILNNVTGLNTALRLSKSGLVQCLSTDGKNCVWGLDTLEKGTKAVLSAIQSKTLKPLSCGKEHTKIYGSPGYDNEKHWCSVGYTRLFKKSNRPDPEVKRTIAEVKKKFVPKWLDQIRHLIKSKQSKDEDGLKRIKEILTKHGFNFGGNVWNLIKKHSQADCEKGHEKAIRIIKENTPSLPKPAPKKTYLDEIVTIIKSNTIEKQAKINKIFKLVHDNGFKLEISTKKMD